MDIASAALESEVYLRYLMIVGGVLGAAGVILAVLSFALGKNVASIWRTYKGWLIMSPLVLGAVGLGREATIIGVALLSIFGFKEYARATGLYRDWWMTGVVYLCIAAATATALMPDPRIGCQGWYGLFIAMPAYAVTATLAVPILRNKSAGQLQLLALAIVGFVYFGWMFSHLGFLANCAVGGAGDPDAWVGYVLYLVFAVELNDISAFTFGKLFGKHKLRPEVSPNKTVEGSLGAVAVSLALPWLLAFSLPGFEARELVLTGLIVGIGGQFGDLAISVIKRDLGVKDMGVLVPGHGGILDRIDSLILVAPLFFHLVRWTQGG